MPRSLPVILAICCLLFSLSTAVGAGNVAQKATYRGNAQSLIFHATACRYFDCKNCTAVFSTRQEALNAGYRPCKVCRP